MKCYYSIVSCILTSCLAIQMLFIDYKMYLPVFNLSEKLANIIQQRLMCQYSVSKIKLRFLQCLISQQKLCLSDYITHDKINASKQKLSQVVEHSIKGFQVHIFSFQHSPFKTLGCDPRVLIPKTNIPDIFLHLVSLQRIVIK